jgi:CRISPR-associated exonuclease Cas4
VDTEGEPQGGRLTFRVSDLKQYFYCPRIVYYHSCLPGVRPTTFKMRNGAEQGLAERQREERRSLKRYGLRRGECFFDLALVSARIGLRGRLDMAIRTDDNTEGIVEAIAVDYKATPGRTVAHFALQVVAYGMLLEELWGVPARRGFLYLIPARRARQVPITAESRARIVAAVEDMADIALRERMPAAPRQRAKCAICEFRRFCNDV